MKLLVMEVIVRIVCVTRKELTVKIVNTVSIVTSTTMSARTASVIPRVRRANNAIRRVGVDANLALEVKSVTNARRIIMI